MSRVLLPREHGAYVQLLAPLTFGWLIADASAVGGLFTICAALAFIANEPLLVLLGHRGKRLRDQARVRAVSMLAVLGPLVAIGAVIALALANRSTQIIAAAVAVPTLILVGLGVAKRQRSLVGESVAAVALTGAAAPIAVAGGMSIVDALAIWLAWAVGFSCSTIAVHRVIDRGKKARTRVDLLHAASFSCIACAAAIAMCKSFAFSLTLPLAISACIVSLIAPPPSKLRKIGFVMVGASIVAMIVALVRHVH